MSSETFLNKSQTSVASILLQFKSRNYAHLTLGLSQAPKTAIKVK